MRRWIAALVLLAAVPATAAAGDFAGIQPLGFSKDGGVFAFEEYGVLDGSGFPYANIYVIDTVKDRYVAGTPVRVRLEDETASLGAARKQAHDKAMPLIAGYDLAGNPGTLAAFNPFTERDTPENRLRYDPIAMQPRVGGSYTIALETFKRPASKACETADPDTTGFRLKLLERAGDPVDTELYADSDVPDSRRCPLGYRLGGVVTFNGDGGNGLHVALVLVLTQGFEGLDGRWIAVPVRP